MEIYLVLTLIVFLIILYQVTKEKPLPDRNAEWDEHIQGQMVEGIEQSIREISRLRGEMIESLDVDAEDTALVNKLRDLIAEAMVQNPLERHRVRSQIASLEMTPVLIGDACVLHNTKIELSIIKAERDRILIELEAERSKRNEIDLANIVYLQHEIEQAEEEVRNKRQQVAAASRTLREQSTWELDPEGYDRAFSNERSRGSTMQRINAV
jgi:hypothetical protein